MEIEGELLRLNTSVNWYGDDNATFRFGASTDFEMRLGMEAHGVSNGKMNSAHLVFYNSAATKYGDRFDFGAVVKRDSRGGSTPYLQGTYKIGGAVGLLFDREVKDLGEDFDPRNFRIRFENVGHASPETVVIYDSKGREVIRATFPKEFFTTGGLWLGVAVNNEQKDPAGSEAVFSPCSIWRPPSE